MFKNDDAIKVYEPVGSFIVLILYYFLVIIDNFLMDLDIGEDELSQCVSRTWKHHVEAWLW